MDRLLRPFACRNAATWHCSPIVALTNHASRAGTARDAESFPPLPPCFPDQTTAISLPNLANRGGGESTAPGSRFGGVKPACSCPSIRRRITGYHHRAMPAERRVPQRIPWSMACRGRGSRSGGAHDTKVAICTQPMTA